MRSVRRRSLSEPRKGTKQIPVEHAGGPPVLLLRTAAVDAAGCGVAVFYVSTVLPRFARDGAHHRISPHCARPHTSSSSCARLYFSYMYALTLRYQ
jgi:hypothetical protein